MMMDLAAEPPERLWEDDDFVVCRSWSRGRRELVVTPSASQSKSLSASRLEHAYELRGALDSAWAAKPIELSHRAGQTALILEDPGGQLLATLVGRPWNADAVLRVGLGIAVALRGLHRQGLVHKDLKPAHVLANPTTGAVWLTGFFIASPPPVEPASSAHPPLIEGTLAYMAPEQTGRMKRSVDSRSDLYSLGVVLYELLTGRLPFVAADAMGWIHCHIANEPAPFEKGPVQVPRQLARIVMKLLAKTAEDRYQSAHGLAVDLERCLASRRSEGEIDPFELGARDASDRPVVPMRLFGRERAIGTLVSALQRVATSGQPELALVSGYSGIGKSSLVEELQKHLSSHHGLFAAGKFDQHKRDIPYAPLTEAFNGLIARLLARPEAELSAWRDAFAAALGSNGDLICAMIPRFEQIVGKQSAVTELSAQDASKRFHSTFCRFVGVFARAEHPLLLFLDDLQWLDAATLDLVECLIKDAQLRHLLLAGAYRDNEVDGNHPLRARLESIKSVANHVTEIALPPLDAEQIEQLVASTLFVQPDAARPLAELVRAKAQGNPFFTIQFIGALADEKLLVFDHESSTWTWSLDGIRAKGHTDNVVDLMIGKFARLPIPTQAILERLSCLGIGADGAVLAAVCALDEAELHGRLADALRTGLLIHDQQAYRFPHDRVQEAAYALIPEAERADLHLNIGRRLATHRMAAEAGEAIFEVVNQFNRGASRIDAQLERDRVAAYNLLAGTRAKAGTAYASALVYLDAGLRLLDEARWERLPELTFELSLLAAECAFLTGNLDGAEEQLGRLSQRANGHLQLAQVTCLSIDLFTLRDRSDRSVQVGLQYLRSLGDDWSEHPEKDELEREYRTFHERLAQRPIESLANLPLMTDPVGRATIDVLTKLQVPALFFDENLHGRVLGRMANLSLAHGNTDGSCFAYCWLAGFVGHHLGDYVSAPRFARLSLELVERPGLERFKARVYCVFGYLVTPWIAPLASGRSPLQRGREVARASGDLTFVAYTSNHLITLGLGLGEPLHELQRDAERGQAVAREARFGLVADFFCSQLMLIRSLRGPDTQLGSAVAELEARLDNHPQLAIAACWHWIRKLQVHFHVGEFASAHAAALKAEPLLWTSTSSFEVADYHFFAGLTCAALATSAPASDEPVYVARLHAHLAQVTVWATHCPENFRNRASLLAAEAARVAGDHSEAQRLYESAIRAAREQGFIHHEGLALQLASRFYGDTGFAAFAELYEQRAGECYDRWGADALVRRLSGGKRPPNQPGRQPTATVDLLLEHVDLATVVQALQAVSSEIDPDELIERLMRSAVQHAVADRGLLILLAGSPRIRAIATTERGVLTLRRTDSAPTGAQLPESLLTYVLRTREKVVISDTRDAPAFADDPYILAQNARSMLCVPIVLQTKLVGALYLENSLTPHSFSPNGLVVLDVLASQAAISLENAQLYAELRQAKVYMGEAERLSRTGSFSWKPHSRELFCSEEVFRIFGVEGATSLEMLKERIHPEDHALFEQVRAEPSRLERSALAQRLLLPDGTVKHLSIVAQRLDSPPGGRLEYVGTVRDVTEIKRAEDALHKTQLALADVTRVASLGEMAAAIAHEVNQPLLAVGINASTCLRWLASDTPNLPEARAAAGRVARDSTLAADVIRRLRQLFAGSEEARASLDLNEAIREVVTLTQNQGRTYGVAVSTDLSSELPTLLGDRVQLQQVVMNLIVNAAEATRDIVGRTREVRIRTSRLDANHVCIEVSDTGVGVRPEDAASIFDAFYTTKPHGMGIGLSMSNTIVKSHGGTLSARANDGPGATFALSLPIAFTASPRLAIAPKRGA